MKSDIPPSTNVFTYFDAMSNEWVTTFTVRHSCKPENPTPLNSSVLSKAVSQLQQKSTTNELNWLGKNYQLPTLSPQNILL